jgi:hypothetical protein
MFNEVQKRQGFAVLKDIMKYFFAVKKIIVKMQKKLETKQWKEELKSFKKAVIEIVNPKNRTTKALEKFHKASSFNYKERRSIEMTNLERICNDCCNDCCKNWVMNDEVVRSERSKAPKSEYQSIEFLELREISIPRYFHPQKVKSKQQEQKKITAL